MSIAEGEQFARATPAPPRYPINLRITVPFYPRYLFVTLIIGSEKRGRDRLRGERDRHPVGTVGNLLVVTIALGVVSIAALFTALVATAF